MAFKSFTLQVFLRLILVLLALACFPLLFLYFDSGQLVFTFLVLAIIACLLIYDLIRYINQKNRQLAELLEQIQSRDFSVHYDIHKYKGSEKELYKSFNRIIRSYKEIRIDREVQYKFIQHIVELIDVGIIAINGKGKIILMNTAATKLLGTSGVLYWEQLQRKCRPFTEVIDGMKDTSRAMLESGDEEGKSDLAIHVIRTPLLDDDYTIIAFQNIKNEVEKRETEAWLKLIRTLNHEIKNSVTPISSLTETILMILQEQDGRTKELEKITPKNLEDIIHSIKTLEKRSNNLYDFVSEYNKLTRIPEPKKELTRLDHLLDETFQLFKADLEKEKILFTTKLHDPEASLNLDPVLIQQVLINLVKNCMEAFEDIPEKSVTISTKLSESGHHIIEVSDNGPGIDKTLIDQVFVPFFSTKGQGTGIGLALVRHIMTLHGGNVSLWSKPGTGTKISLKF